MNKLKWILDQESGQGLVEYSLIISLVAVVVLVAILGFGDSLFELYDKFKNDFINAL